MSATRHNKISGNKESNYQSVRPRQALRIPKNKRLIVCCDGTTNDRNRKEPVTNVARIERFIAAEDYEGKQQITHYLTGVGTADDLLAHHVDQAVASSKVINVSQATSRDKADNCSNW